MSAVTALLEVSHKWEVGSRQAGGDHRVAGLVGGKLGCERLRWCSRFVGGRLGG
jgi:hypothetical protein